MFDSSADMSSLPVPSEAQCEHSQRLVARLCEHIATSGGAITLGEYVHAALYTPTLGYYAAGTRKFGEQGDFVTAPELGSVFAECMARGVARVFDELGSTGRTDFLELGAGSGQFAYDCLLALRVLEALPDRYRILEVSADLKERQADLLATLPHDLFDRVEWLEEPPTEDFQGVVFANEVIDALPMERFGVADSGDTLMEMIRVNDSGALQSSAQPAKRSIEEAVAKLQASLPDSELWPRPYVGEVRTGVESWLRSVTAHLTRGAALFVDYGADAAEVYRADRTTGTLLCHYRHRAHDNVLLWPGLQDITCWVDFTQVAQAALNLGFELNGYASQTHLLIDCELDDVVSARFSNDSQVAQLRLASQVKQLTLPGEMGERFKAISLSRGLSRGLLTPAHTGLERRL